MHTFLSFENQILTYLALNEDLALKNKDDTQLGDRPMLDHSLVMAFVTQRSYEPSHTGPLKMYES